MRRRRALRAVSVALIAAGVLALADAAVTAVWLEPVTALRAKLSQDELARDLRRLELARPAAIDERLVRRVHGRGPRAARRRVAILARGLRTRRADGHALGRLRVPRLRLSTVIVKGSSSAPLRKGPGTFDGTPLPGERGTAAIAGHRTTYGAPFRDIDALRRGDLVVAQMPYATVRYRVEGHRIVEPDDLGVLRRVRHDRLILSACHPRFTAKKRIVVFAREVQVVPAGLGRSATSLKRVARRGR
jgi:sortase A